MRKIIFVVVLCSLLLPNVALAQAHEASPTDSLMSPISLITNSANYDVRELSFIAIDNLIAIKKNTEMSAEQVIQSENIKNLTEIRQFIKNLNLKDLGQGHLELILLEELKDLETKSGYIERYRFYSPKTNMELTVSSVSSPTYYGTYSNHEFRNFFSVYTDAYQRHSYDSNKHQQWAQGIIDFALIFAPVQISIPYWALSLANRNDIITFRTESIRHDGSDEVTRHYITIQDIYNIMRAGSNQYYVTIVDEARVNTTDAVIDFASPTKQTAVDNISFMTGVYCSTWSNSTISQMVRGYNQFYYDPGAPTYNLVGRFSIPWQ